MDDKGIIYMRHPTTYHVVRCEIPAPVETDYELVAEGWRYTAVALDAIVALINTATGLTFGALWGKRVIRT
jgi:hypothetical protein